MEELLSSKVRELRLATEQIAEEVIAPRASEVDREATWPAHALHALGEGGLLGLHVPRHFGGHGQGLVALAVLAETIAKACPSSALCYGMHCVGTAVMAAKATSYHEERYLRPIAAGRHITSLSLSESGTGSHFYLSESRLTRDDDNYVVHATKQFVTSGGHADSYVISTMASSPAQAGEFNCLIVDGSTPGISWMDPWRGFGMRGNSSRGMQLEGVRVPVQNLLGEEGDEIWYVFEVIAPYFLIAMSGTYLGIAQAALDTSLEHLRSRRHSFSGDSLAHVPLLQHRIAELWTAVEKARLLVYHAARLGDLGDPQALTAIFACKADVADVAVAVTNEAMTLCGGVAYRENSRLARLLRDARASHVMAPTTDMLKQWAGRALLGLPLL